MRLFHGTAASILPKIEKEGLLPRAISKGKDNWKHSISSNREAIYLTTAYAFHFAACAVEGFNQPSLILEIDSDKLLPWLLCPDEDFLEQATRGQGPSPTMPQVAATTWSLKKRNLYYRGIAKFNPKMAEASLKNMGTVAYYGSIPWSAITRYVVIDWTKIDPAMRIRSIDSQVSIVNYGLLKDRHESLTKWFFGDPVTPGEVTGNDKWRQLGMTDPATEMYDRMDNAMTEAMANRDGLKVVVCPEKELVMAT